MRKLAVMLAAALAFAAASAHAQQQPNRNFFIVNATNYGIKFIGVNPPGDEEWNENELGGVLAHGSIIKVTFNDTHKGCAWNVKVIWADDDSSSYFRNIDACRTSVIALKYNKNTNTASYAAQ